MLSYSYCFTFVSIYKQKNMKKIRLSPFVVLLTSVLIITSCSKKDDPKSRTDLLTAKSWTMTKLEIMAVGTTYTDVTSTIEDCDKDDINTYSKAFVYKFDAGKNDCDGDKQTETGKWAFKDGEKTLSITVGSTTADLPIESLSATTLTIKKTEDIGFGNLPYRRTFTGK